MSFWLELKRRRVWRVAVAYGATALGTALAVAELHQYVGLPEGTPQVVILEVDLPIPDHTTLSRRLKTFRAIRFRSLATNRPIHLLIDSTGLRIHVGHMQKPPRNRAWRKLHFAVDAASGEIVASDLTARRTHDSTQVPTLLGQIGQPLASISADGAYDTRAVYEAAREQGKGRAVRVLIPPGRNAQLSPKPSSAMQERNRNVRLIRELGRREWHRSSGYSKRSMVENTVFRYKTIIGRSMRSRTLDGQRVEVRLACKILNSMTRLGEGRQLPSGVSSLGDGGSALKSEPCTNAIGIGHSKALGRVQHPPRASRGTPRGVGALRGCRDADTDASESPTADLAH